MGFARKALEYVGRAIRQTGKRFSNLWREGPAWLKRAIPFGWGLLGIGCSALVGSFLPYGGDHLSTRAGLWLQLAGYGMLAWRLGVLQERAWWLKLIDWVRDFPFKRTDHRTVEASSTLSMASGMSAAATRGMPEEGTDAQIHWLRDQVTRLRKQSQELERKIDAKVGGLQEQMRQLREESRQARGTIEEKIDRLTRGRTLTFEGIALSWLILGRVMTGGLLDWLI